MDNGWAKVKQAAQYSGVSSRTFREWLKSGLRHVRIPSGTILTKSEWIDQYLIQFEADADQAGRVDQIVDDVLGDI